MIVVTSGRKYIDIDGYAGIIAYANLLKLKGIPAIATSTAKINKSITESLLNFGIRLDAYVKNNEDEFILIDVSNIDFFDAIVDKSKIVEIIDHHTGYETYWKNVLKEKARIEFIGSVATIIVEDYEKANLLTSMSKEIAQLLMCAILDNTLNFKAKITNIRDINAYNKLAKLVNSPENYAEKYFLECQKTAEEDLEKAIENDLKIEKVCDYLPETFGQLTIWNKDIVLSHLDVVYKIFNNKSDEWMLNLISLEEGKSYIIVNNNEVKAKLEELFNNEFKDDIMELDCVWLRKEIMKMGREKK